MTKVKNVKLKNWGLWLGCGIILMAIGLVLLSSPVWSTLASIFVFGSLFVAAGIIHIILALVDKDSDHLWLHLIIAAFTLVVGILMLLNPLVALATLTLLIAAFFLSSGLFRIIGGLMVRFNGWGWYILNGLISLLLGILIILHWPTASLWVIGLFIGIDFLFAGLSLIMISLFVKKGALFG